MTKEPPSLRGVGKFIVVGARDRTTRKVSATKIGNAVRQILHDFVDRNVVPDGIVYADDHHGCLGLASRVPDGYAQPKPVC